MFARQGHHAESAILQGCMQPSHAVSRGAETDCGVGLVKTQQVHDCVLDLRWGDGYRLIRNIAVAATLTCKGETQRISLIAFGQSDDRRRQGGGEQQCATSVRGRVEDFFQILAKTHVEHLVCLVEHHTHQAGQVKRAAFEVIAQPTGSAYDDSRSPAQGAAFLACIHSADAGGDAKPGLCI